ncbi:uncharacterized protein PAC_02065 [Phialocephala subalpina]|uniref:Smr domain-containing protein n=1 Tax=Phialocephala subalpina TaxID=576137 RepID=A0A1L7WHD7_9HELO|nr:uncharacterized protein PAC_02065 [Phialocephala subalpina]
MTNIAGLQAQLLEEYSKYIDASTVLAILSDYDVANASQLEEARHTLEILKSTVTSDEATGFDPSGASGTNDDQESARGEDESASARSARGWRSQTDDTSLNQDLSSLDLDGLDFSEGSRDDSTDQTYPSPLDGLDQESKENILMGMFPALNPFDIKWTLKKCKGDGGLAIDELMTQSFLEESGTRHRGIEAFSESEASRRPRKGKGKKKRNTRAEEWHSESPASPATPESPASKWDTGKQDIQFIADKTGMPIQQVNSIFHNSGGSVPTTISAIVQAHAALNIESDDPMVQINTAELRQDYPTIPQSEMEILVQITYPSISNARDLAKALASRPNKKSGIRLDIRHAPLQLDPEPSKAKLRAHNAVQPFDRAEAAAMVSSYREGRNAAFTQAHAAYRKGKSNHLMGEVAAYYSQIGRDLDAKARSAVSDAADALVATQSTRNELDLHGLNVKDAVRVSREKVTAWWHQLGEGRVGGKGVGSGYFIVTGQGRHTDGGRGKLGPAVVKMLMKEGWKVEVLSGNNGKLVVTGVATKR